MRIPIAVPDFAVPPELGVSGSTLAEVLRYDLDFTGLFRVMPPANHPPAFTGFGADPARIRFDIWKAAGADYLVYGMIVPAGDKLNCEFRLFDTVSGDQVVGQRLAPARSDARLAVHMFSDEIARFLSGTQGVATSEICFTCYDGKKKEVYVSDYDGFNPRKVTNHQSISIKPKFSPDGRQIAYLSYKDRYPFLYIYSRSTGVSTVLSKQVGLNAAPGWSPDGRSLAVVLSKDGNPEIYVKNADGSGGTRLTKDQSVDSSPTFHPSGQQLAFVSERGGNPQLYVMSANGSGVRRLSYQGGKSYDPAWSPDGKSIAYVVDKSGQGFEIFVMNADGSSPRQLTSSSGTNESPSWSPDSRHVIFTSTRTGRSELWTVTVETGQERRVALPTGLHCEGPSWGARQ